MRLPTAVFPILASAAAWAILFAALPPERQNFPLDDDWAYARGAVKFAETHRVDYSHWAAMPQLGQWLWAYPFITTFGPTHIVLRVSTILLSWLGLCAFCDLLAHLGVGRGPAALASTALALNPLFFLLQGTFMTDVPALSFALIALAFYFRALIRGEARWLVPATAVAILAVSTRQNTVVAPLVAGLLLLQRPMFRYRPLWLGSVCLPLAAAVAIQYWFRQRPDVLIVDPHLPAPYALVLFPFLICHFFGLASLPLLPVGRWSFSWQRYAVLAICMVAGAIYWKVFEGYLPFQGLFPYANNLLTPRGAFWAKDLMRGDRPVLAGTGIRLLFTIAGCLAGAVWGVRFLARCGETSDPLLWFSLGQIPLILLAPLFDRYLLFLLPGALYFATPRKDGSAWSWAGALGALAILSALSVGLMHDWLAWNSARWALGRRAIDEKHISAQDIEGGFEWDGTYTVRSVAPPRTDPPGALTLPATYYWFQEITGKFALAFSVLPGTEVVDKEPYRLWLVPGEQWIFLLRASP
jgi:hypothetical protein